MAGLQARFEADFSQFYSAVEKAEVKLRSFDAGAAKVSAQLSRVQDSLSGRKLIQDATLMAKAVENIGGPAKLTANELQNVSAKAAEAAAKMKAMGMDVPPGLQKIADATKNVGTAASSSTPLISGMAKQLAGMFTIGAAIAFGREILNAGDAIKKMADQTGLTYDQVQRLQYIAGQTGVSMTTLVSAVQNLQQRLGDDSTGAAAAMRKLGIHADAFNKLNTYEQVLSLSTALAAETDVNERASQGAALFGKTWKEVGPAITANMQQIGDEAPKMTDAVVESLDRTGDALTRGKQQAVVWGSGFAAAFEGAGFAVRDFLSRFNPQNFGLATSQVLKIQGAINDPSGLVGALGQASIGASKLSRSLGADLKPVIAQTADEERILNTRIQESVRATEAAAKAVNERRAALLAMSKAGLGAEFDWQRELDFSKFKATQLRVVETQLFDQRGDMVEFMSRYKGEMFPEPPPGSLDAWKKAQITLTETALKVPVLDSSLDKLATTFAHLAQTSGSSFASVARDIGTVLTAMQLAGEAGKLMGDGFKQGGAAGYANLAAGALAAAGAIDAATNSMSRAKNVLGGAAAGASTGMKIGASTNIPGASIIGAGAGAIVGAFVGWAKSNSMEGRTVSPIRDEFFKLAGGLEKLNPLLQHFTGNFRLVEAIFKASNIDQYNAAMKDLQGELARIDALTRNLTAANQELHGRLEGVLTLTPLMEEAFAKAYDAKTPEDFLAAIGEINRSVDLATTAHDSMTEAAKKYGITIDGMGKAWQSQELNKKAQDLFKDYELLTKGGADHTAVVKGMGKEVDAYLDHARKMGIEVPESMQPMIQKFIDAGQLTDDQGKKIKDLQGIGVTFGATLEQSMGKVATSLERLVTLLEEKLGPAIQNIPDGMFTVRGKVEMPDKLPQGYKVPDMPDIHGMAAGGVGRASRPTIVPMEREEPATFAFQTKRTPQ